MIFKQFFNYFSINLLKINQKIDEKLIKKKELEIGKKNRLKSKIVII